MNLTRYQIQTLYWLAEERKISSYVFRSKSLSFEPCLILEKLGLITITGDKSYQTAHIEHQGDLVVRKLQELATQYKPLNLDLKLKLMVKLAKRLELSKVDDYWIIFEK